MTERLSAMAAEAADVLLLWGCLLGTFALLPAERPAWSMLLAVTVIRVLVGAASRQAWRNRVLVAVAGGILFFFLWGRGPDAAGLAAWLALAILGRALAAWLKTQAALPRAVRGFMLGLAQALGRLLAAAFRRVRAEAAAPWTLYLRIALLLLAAAALMKPYLTRGVVGAGDALWYSYVVSDFVGQVRAGIFPVWVGQTSFSFMGGTFPMRVAPWLQHLAAVIDLATGRRLPGFVLLNLTLTACFAGGLLSCYFCIGRVLPRRPWTAASLAFLYATCPGVIGLAYGQDLFLSFTSLPFLPWVFLGIVRSFERDDAISRLLIAGGLAATWLAHPPIALWCGLVAAASQAVRLWKNGWSRRSLRLDLLAVVAFAALAGYSFVSVASLGPRIVDGSTWQSELFEVRSSFPGNWLLLPRANSLEDLQLGYGLAAVLAFVLASLPRRRDALILALGLSAALLFALLVPIPVFTGLLWHIVPPAILKITKTWPMQRLNIVLALSIVFAAALLERSAPARSLQRRWLTGGVLALALGWSGWQASCLASYIGSRAQTREQSTRMQLEENLVLTRSTLGISPFVPRWFSNGVMDPAMEHYFLDRGTEELRTSASDAIAPGFGPGAEAAPNLGGTLTGTLDANPGILDLAPSLTLEPGRRYLLLLQFLQPAYTGVLIVRGPEFYREYPLPSDAGPWAFGSAPENAHAISLWTSLGHAETVRLEFVPTAAGAKPMDFTPFARFELRPYDQSQLAVQVESLAPYRARVRSAGPAYLETPRLFVPGYQARTDGAPVPVKASSDGMVLVPVEAGVHTVALDYIPPLAVQASFWGGLGAWAVFFWALLTLRRSKRGLEKAS